MEPPGCIPNIASSSAGIFGDLREGDILYRRGEAEGELRDIRPEGGLWVGSSLVPPSKKYYNIYTLKVRWINKNNHCGGEEKADDA